MGRYHAVDEYEPDPEEPDESDMDSDDGDEFAEMENCPHCGKRVYESAEQCPACGNYLSQEDRRGFSQPKWIVATVLVLLAIVLFGWIRWGF